MAKSGDRWARIWCSKSPLDEDRHLSDVPGVLASFSFATVLHKSALGPTILSLLQKYCRKYSCLEGGALAPNQPLERAHLLPAVLAELRTVRVEMFGPGGWERSGSLGVVGLGLEDLEEVPVADTLQQLLAHPSPPHRLSDKNHAMIFP